MTTTSMEQMGTEVTEDKELGWEEEINQEGADFILAPEGDYDFKVVSFTRERHNGSDKLPPCNKAVLDIEVATPKGAAHIRHQLFLHTKTEGMLSAFFIGIGQKKHGEPLRMNWNNVIGSTGRCKVGIREYNGKQYNEIKKFYDPSKNVVATDTTEPNFTPGKF